MRSIIDLNYDYQGGLTSVLFSMFTFYLCFKLNKRKQISILYIFILPAKYVSITILFSLFCLTPNKSFFSNLSGILNGYLIKFLPFIFLPRINWVRDFEQKFIFKFEKLKYLYRNINKRNYLMVNALNELQKNSMNDNIIRKNIIENYNDNIDPRMNESSNNINNNANDE